jgi:hypothetical protein
MPTLQQLQIMRQQIQTSKEAEGMGFVNLEEDEVWLEKGTAYSITSTDNEDVPKNNIGFIQESKIEVNK